jgi:elongation factor 3
LAYGAKILLNTPKLHLKRGHRYGLCGENGTGKSTLMRAITNGYVLAYFKRIFFYLCYSRQFAGFPSPDEGRTFHVQHDVDGSEEDTSVLSFLISDERIQVDEAECIGTLASVSFNDERQQYSIERLSGGWKTKFALARATLFKADILLLMSLPIIWMSLTRLR